MFIGTFSTLLGANDMLDVHGVVKVGTRKWVTENWNREMRRWNKEI